MLPSGIIFLWPGGGRNSPYEKFWARANQSAARSRTIACGM